MTSRTVPVSAQWALQGKQPDGEDYRILASSTGDLTRANFADALSRFQLGELSTLPQVAVSYARHGTRPGLSYVALAIHWYATEGQRHADGVSQRDNQGRPTAYTSYFCLPYHRLADEAIGYLSIYEALRAITLTVADGPPKDIPITMPTSRTPAADDLAVCVAPLLLTGQPVCVLGAEGTSMLERLEFIDAVMELLPYGFRSRMTAATWTRATNRNHRFRLFFSGAPRTDEPEYVVIWGDDPGLIRIPAGEAGEYFDWLQDNLGPLARLAELTSEMGFGQKDTLQALEAVLGTSHRLHLRPWTAAPAPNGRPGPPPTRPAPVQADAGGQALAACAEHLKLENPTRLRSDINLLRRLAEGEISEKSRLRYQNLIGGLGLLRDDVPVEDKYREKLYDALLRLAFGVPLSYKAYCWVEQCAGIVHGAAPHRQLLAAIVKCGMTDPFVSAIVYWHLGATDEKKLNKWLVSGQVNVIRLIDLLAVGSSYAQHARIVCDVTLEYLRKAPNCYRPQEVKAKLHEHGFLARALQKHNPDKDQYQVHALYQFLKVAYPQPAATPGQDLSRAAIQQILNGTGPPPTPALLGAVLMLLDRPQSWQLAWNAYVHGCVNRPNFADTTRERLRERLPPIDAAAISAPEPRPGQDWAQPARDIAGWVARGPRP
jgi:hypothetical protein